MRGQLAVLGLLCLSGCPWISGPPPGDIEPDTDSVECVDVDFDGVCDHLDACVDGVDDTTDTYVIQDGTPLSGLACGDDESIRVAVQTGCSYTVHVDGPSTVGVEIIEDSYIVASGQAPLWFDGVSSSFDVWEVLLFGDDDAYTVTVNSQCPQCGQGRIVAEWGDVVTTRLCPWAPEVTVAVNSIQPWCDYGVNLVTSDRTETTLMLTDGVNTDSLSDNSGYLAIVGPVSPNATRFQAVVSQPPGAEVEQGVRLELAEYCE